MLRPKIGLDWDDVTAPFNSIAIAMANEKYHIDPPLRLEEIDTWENRGRTGIIREFYEDEELYARQQVPEKNKKAVYRLMEIADVYFITAVAPAFMGIRANRFLQHFRNSRRRILFWAMPRIWCSLISSWMMPFIMCLRHRPRIRC